MRELYWRERIEAEAWALREGLSIGAEVGLALRRTRFDLGLSQRAYAVRRGWSVAHLGRLEAQADAVRLGVVLEALEPTRFGVVVLAVGDPARTTPVPPECAPEPPRQGFRRAWGEEGSVSVRNLDALAAQPKGHGPCVSEGSVADDIRRVLVEQRSREELSRRRQASRFGMTEPMLRRRERDPGMGSMAELSRLAGGCGHVLHLVASRVDGAHLVMPWEWPSSELVARDRSGRRRFPGHRGAQPAGFIGPIWWWMSGEGGNRLEGMPRWESGPDPRWRRPGMRGSAQT